MKDRNGVEFTKGCKCKVVDNIHSSVDINDVGIFDRVEYDVMIKEEIAILKFSDATNFEQAFLSEEIEIIGSVRDE